MGCWRGCLSGARCRLACGQLMPLPLTVSCFSKIQIGFTFLVPAHPGSPVKRAVKQVCVCVLLAGSLSPHVVHVVCPRAVYSRRRRPSGRTSTCVALAWRCTLNVSRLRSLDSAFLPPHSTSHRIVTRIRVASSDSGSLDTLWRWCFLSASSC